MIKSHLLVKFLLILGVTSNHFVFIITFTFLCFLLFLLAISKFKATKIGFHVRMNFTDSLGESQSLLVASGLCELIIGLKAAEYRKEEKACEGKEEKLSKKRKTGEKFKIIKGMCTIIYHKHDTEDNDGTDASFLSGGGACGEPGSQSVLLPLAITAYE